MAERLKDREDLELESLFRSAPIEDAGFSDRVVGRIRRQIWIRRLALPIAFVVGGAIAVRPLSQLVMALYDVVAAMPQKIGSRAEISSIFEVPHLSTVVLGLLLLGVVLVTIRLLED